MCEKTVVVCTPKFRRKLGGAFLAPKDKCNEDSVEFKLRVILNICDHQSGYGKTARKTVLIPRFTGGAIRTVLWAGAKIETCNIEQFCGNIWQCK